jgi:hypothetical protein
MTTTTVLSNKYFDLLFHEDTKIIHHIYKPLMSSDQLKELLSAGTDLMEKYRSTKWISDNRQLVNTFSDEAAQWVNNVWLPRTVKAGWKYWAMVVPDSVIGRADHIKYVESFHNTGIWVTVYTTVEPAMDWLESR